jgi:hypothetical protein
LPSVAHEQLVHWSLLKETLSTLKHDPDLREGFVDGLDKREYGPYGSFHFEMIKAAAVFGSYGARYERDEALLIFRECQRQRCDSGIRSS